MSSDFSEKQAEQERRAAAQAVHLAELQAHYVPAMLTALWTCKRCGVVVSENWTEVHNQWHVGTPKPDLRQPVKTAKRGVK